jgi:hypothetical protein
MISCSTSKYLMTVIIRHALISEVCFGLYLHYSWHVLFHHIGYTGSMLSSDLESPLHLHHLGTTWHILQLQSLHIMPLCTSISHSSTSLRQPCHPPCMYLQHTLTHYCYICWVQHNIHILHNPLRHSYRCHIYFVPIPFHLYTYTLMYISIYIYIYRYICI